MKMKVLSVCVLALLAADCVYGVNLAHMRPTRQSSTFRGIYNSDRAVDGNTGMRFFRDTCTHTDCRDRNPYWTVCLGRSQTITSLNIYNPFESSGRLRNIRVEVFETNPNVPGAVGELCAEIGYGGAPDGTVVPLHCRPNVRGRYVRISKTNVYPNRQNFYCDALILCEVEVFGSNAPLQCPAGFSMYNGSCYHFSTGLATWFGARQACRTLGGDLAIIPDANLNTYIKSRLSPTPNTGYWFGGHKLTDGLTWQWIDPNVNFIYQDFAPNRGYDQTRQCLLLGRDAVSYQWYDEFCYFLQNYICEYTKGIPGPANQQCF